MGLHKVIKYIAYALGIIGAVLALIIMVSDKEDTLAMSGNILVVAYVVLGLVLAMVLIFVIKGLFEGNIKKTLLTVGVFVAVIAISYGISSGTDLDLKPFTDKGVDVDANASKIVGAGLYAFYILAVLAIVSMLFGGAKKIFNK